jgi:hypothetical protein
MPKSGGDRPGHHGGIQKNATILAAPAKSMSIADE